MRLRHSRTVWSKRPPADETASGASEVNAPREETPGEETLLEETSREVTECIVILISCESIDMYGRFHPSRLLAVSPTEVKWR